MRSVVPEKQVHERGSEAEQGTRRQRGSNRTGGVTDHQAGCCPWGKGQDSARLEKATDAPEEQPHHHPRDDEPHATDCDRL